MGSIEPVAAEVILMEGLKRTLIGDALPPQFVYDLGLYLQTCAHVEVRACSLICTLEAAVEKRNFDSNRFHILRKLGIKELINELKTACKYLDEEYATGLNDLVEWVDTYKTNRHIAAHGAFFVRAESKDLRVLYTHKRKDHGKPVYTAEDASISRDTVVEYLRDADRILRSVAGLETEVSAGRVALRNPP